MAFATVASAAPPAPAVSAAKRRAAVLQTTDIREKSKAYRELFEALGPADIRELKGDADIGISLQAAWEVGRKAVKRPNVEDGWTYDPMSRERFLGFLEGRTHTEVPDWWGSAIRSMRVFPGQHHGLGDFDLVEAREESAAGVTIIRGVSLKKEGAGITLGDGIRTIKFPTEVIDSVRKSEVIVDELTASLYADRSLVALHTGAGFPFTLICLDSKTGKHLWQARVWAAGRSFLGGAGVHRMAFQRHDNVLAIYGLESHGAYVEAFDMESGKCLYRFCTGYWMNHSEAWKL